MATKKAKASKAGKKARAPRKAPKAPKALKARAQGRAKAAPPRVKGTPWKTDRWFVSPWNYDPEVINLISSRCTEVESGARAVDAILTHTLLPEISRTFLTRLMEGAAIRRVHVGAADGQFTYSFD